LQHAPATSELVFVYLATREALLENLQWIDPELSRSVTRATTPVAAAATSVQTQVVVPFVTARSLLVFMPVLPVLGTGPDAQCGSQQRNHWSHLQQRTTVLAFTLLALHSKPPRRFFT
jgi:hypothetical protein